MADHINDVKGPKDASRTNWVDQYAPDGAKDLLRLMRFDRPIGIWLLLFPALWAIVMASHMDNRSIPSISDMVLFLIGAILMRAAGCVYNDIIDKDLDAKVERTRLRPLASGAISTQAAGLLLVGLLGLAFMILLQLPPVTRWLGLLALIPVAIYPFGKRFTYWPQLVLGICFSMSALMGWSAVRGSVDWPALLIALATVFWTLGFDTIYAHQDKLDDSVLGIKSTALKFGKATPNWLMLFYGMTLICLFAAGWMSGTSLLFFTVLALASMQMAWQMGTLNLDNPDNCLTRFKSNQLFGLIIFGGLVLDQIMAQIIG